ncbi:MAG: hypothetical protein MHM6MM_001608 [Cercozoa sp. M6MM]
MGGVICKGGIDDSDEARRNRDIERQLANDQTKSLLDFKVLVLGAGESGKSTVVKQLRNIHKGKAAFTEDEILGFTSVLQTNTIQSMKLLVKAVEFFDLEFDDAAVADSAAAIDEKDDNATLSLDDAVHVERLWKSKAIQTVYERRNEIYFPDAGPYYFDNVYRFVEDGFRPTEEDVVMARIRTTGMFMTEFDLTDPPVHWRVVDVGGQRSERKKWIKFFDDVQAILFVVNLSGYNKVLFEDQSKNRMQEAMELFDKIANTDVFADTPVFLWLNKKDLFEESLQATPITSCFPDYTGSDNVHECLDHIGQAFKNLMPNGKELADVQPISARVKRDVRTVFEDMQAKLIQINSKSIQRAVRQLDDK